MPLIKWRPSLSVNVSEVDKQHQKLINLINDLSDAMKAGQGSEVVEKILKELHDYTVVHFSFEENYFDKFGYSDTENHKRAHAHFVKKIKDFHDEFKEGKVSLSIELMDFLSDWLRNHIMGTDKKYVSFFHEHGIK